MKPGETSTNKKRITFELFDAANGAPCSGKTGEGLVFVAVAGDIQKNRDAAGYSNVTVGCLASFVHVGDGVYDLVPDDTEIAAAGGEGQIKYRIKKDTDIRAQVITIPLLYDSVDSIANNAITAAAIATDAIDADALKADAVTEIQSGLALAVDLATVAGYVDTEVAAIKAKTDNLPSDPADASDIAAAFSTVNSTLATIAGYIDTEVASIKATVEALPSASAVATAVFAYVTETGITFVEAVRAVTALAIGRETDATVPDSLAPITFLSFDGLKTRISALWTAGVKVVTKDLG